MTKRQRARHKAYRDRHIDRRKMLTGFESVRRTAPATKKAARRTRQATQRRARR